VPRLRLRDGGSPNLEMLEGVLTLESSSLPTVQVEAGMCLLEDATTSEHPFADLSRNSCG
jgi:hypothetical protein